MITESGNLLRHLTSKLLAFDSVFRGVQRALLSTLDARRSVDRNAGRILATLNFPSHADVERLLDQVEELDRELADLSARIAKLSAHQAPETPGPLPSPNERCY